MGSMQAGVYAEAAREGWVDLRTVVTAHLRGNHYPPLPYALVTTALEVIERTEAGETIDEARVFLPDGILFRGREQATLGQLIEALHLHAFIGWDEIEDD